MDSIPSPQTILTMHNNLTMAMLPAGVKNSQDYDSRNFLSWNDGCAKIGQRQSNEKVCHVIDDTFLRHSEKQYKNEPTSEKYRVGRMEMLTFKA